MTLNQNSLLVFIILIYIGDIKFLFLWGVGGGGVYDFHFWLNVFFLVVVFVCFGVGGGGGGEGVYDLQLVLNVIFIFSPEITV